MSASQRRALDAIAFELAAAVENYEQATEKLVATWFDPDLYESISRQVDHMRNLSASLPQVAVPWVGLLIAHAELVHCLWKCGETDAPSAEFQTCRERHVRAVLVMRERCLWLFSSIDGQRRA